MKLIKILFIALLTLSFFISTGYNIVSAQNRPYRGIHSDDPYIKAIQEGRRLVDSLMTAQNIPGLEIAVSVQGKTVWAEGFGYADVENKLAVWPFTKMRIGSVSKLLTSAALGKLIEKGKIDIDAPVRKYVPYFPKKEYTITTREVAGHLAGIRHYKKKEFLSSKHYNSVKAGLKIFMYDSLLSRPGEKYHYSSYGWNLISAVIEGASGNKFLDYMQENVFDPIGMTQTVPGYNKAIIAHRTRFYSLNKARQVINAPYVDNSYKWASGGFLSTVNDLLKFGNAMLGEEFLSRKVVNLLWEPQTTTGGKNTHHGMDWVSGKDPQGFYWVGHSGGSVGGTTKFAVYPEQKIVVAVISNLGGVSYGDFQFKIADAFITATYD